MHCFIVGYYGFNNVGDDVCLAQTCRLLKGAFNECTWTFLGKETDRSKHEISRWNIGRVCAEIARSDRVILGGGGLLQNKTSQLSLYYYLGLVLVAIICRVPVIGLGQGIGPIHGWISKGITRFILRLFEDIPNLITHS